jgi:cytochrome c oxidase subunit 4
LSQPTRESSEHRQEHGGYGVYLLTWTALLVFTAITVSVAGMHLGKISVLAAVAIAAVKASLVLSYFMHLRDELPMFRVMFFVAILALAIFIGLTFFDPPLRS